VKGDIVKIDYTLWVEDLRQSDRKGKLIGSHEDWMTAIGMGVIILGWEIAIPQMTLGEISIMWISSDYAYDEKGFPGHIPGNSNLVFHIILKDIKRKEESKWLSELSSSDDLTFPFLSFLLS